MVPECYTLCFPHILQVSNVSIYLDHKNTKEHTKNTSHMFEAKKQPFLKVLEGMSGYAAFQLFDLMFYLPNLVMTNIAMV